MKKSNKKNINYVEKYFQQKEWTPFEYICLCLGLVFVGICIFAPYGLSYGLPALLVTIAAFAISKTSKIEYTVVEDRLEELLRANKVEEREEVSLATYDYECEHVLRGGDGIIRSNRYVVCKCTPKKETTEIRVLKLELITGEVEKESYSIPKDQKIELISKEIATSKGKKTIHFLSNDQFKNPIPVCVDDVNESDFIKEICKLEYI